MLLKTDRLTIRNFKISDADDERSNCECEFER